MYDILANIFKNPGNSFSPIPFWFLNDDMDPDELVRQISEFHKKGVDGLVIHPRIGFDSSIEYLSPEYMDLMELCAKTAAKKRMMLVLYDEAMYPSGSAHGMVVKANPLYAARALFAVPAGSRELLPGEEILLTLPLTDAFTVAKEGEAASEYDLVLGFTGGTIRGIHADEDDGMENAPPAADLLNPEAVDAFIENTHAKYHSRLGSYFGTTIIGFFTDEPSLTGRGARMNGKITWTYDLLDEFIAEGGDENHLAALLFETADKRKKRDAEEIYRRTIRKRLGNVYYAKLSDWCEKHGIALMGHPAASSDCEFMKYFQVPGQDLVWRMVEHGTELTSPDSVMAKCTADTARHLGASRNSNECFGVCGTAGNPWDFTAGDMMRILNFLFARGVNMIIPHAFYYSLRTPLQSDERPPDVGPNNIWWEDYRKISGYIKRMSWLNAMNYNNPCCAVLCSNEYMPVKPVAGLYENGYTFNYLTLDDVMNRAHIHDGKIIIDRYQYDILLIDNRVRLDPAIVLKLGRMVTEGGKMYRGNDFLGFVSKNVKKTSFFSPVKKDEAQAKNIRFVHLTKSGYPFFLCFNEGDETVSGHVITDKSGLCEVFDPFTGDRTELKGEICSEGIRYPVTVKPNTVVVLGLNTDVLPSLGKNPVKTVAEITALPVSGGNTAVFEYHPSENRSCTITFAEVHDACRVKVNGENAGFLCFAPWELDVTKFLTDGENTVEVEVIESMANKYGKPVPSGVSGCAAEIYVTE